MRGLLIFGCLLFGLCNSSMGSVSMCLDSIAVERNDKGVFIVHEVEAGETLFALSRKYDVHVRLIQAANKADVSNLSIGQKVLIPALDISSEDGTIIHNVASSETLFSISRAYNVQVEDLKEWNNLSDNTISTGQRLVIQEPGESTGTQIQEQETDGAQHMVQESETLYSISKKYDMTTEELIELNGLESNAVKIGQVLMVTRVDKNTVSSDLSNTSMLPVDPTNARASSGDVLESEKADAQMEETAVAATEAVAAEEEELPKPQEKIMQKGLAEINLHRSETKKYLGLHRDAPIGTIMQVRNEMNDQSVFIRIVGTIPDTGDNAKVILKISQKAYDRLGAVDARFPVEISYIP